jgi:hypothetical protein
MQGCPAWRMARFRQGCADDLLAAVGRVRSVRRDAPGPNPHTERSTSRGACTHECTQELTPERDRRE